MEKTELNHIQRSFEQLKFQCKEQTFDYQCDRSSATAAEGTEHALQRLVNLFNSNGSIEDSSDSHKLDSCNVLQNA